MIHLLGLGNDETQDPIVEAMETEDRQYEVATNGMFGRSNHHSNVLEHRKSRTRNVKKRLERQKDWGKERKLKNDLMVKINTHSRKILEN